MNDVIDALLEIKRELLNPAQPSDKLPGLISRVKLYAHKLAPNSAQYKPQIDAIKLDSETPFIINKAYINLGAVVDTLIEEVRLAETYTIIPTEKYQSIIDEINKSDETQKNIPKLRLQLEAERAKNAGLESELNNFKNKYSGLQHTHEKSNSELNIEKAYHEQLKSQVESLKADKEVQEGVLNNSLLSARTEISQLKEEKQKREIAKNSVNFQKQADANKKSAFLWMWAVIAAIVVFITILYMGYKSSDELFTIATTILAKSKGLDAIFINKLILIEVAKKLGSKALIYSMLIYLISFLVKNYNAQMHNFVVNSHKSNALSSTVDLIGTAKQDDGNDKIILQATQAIFTTQKSGYQGTENEPSSPNLITNVIDSVMPKKG